jgi:hypothetical protein
VIKLTHDQIKEKLTIEEYWQIYQKLTGETNKLNFYAYVRDTPVWEALCFLTLFDEVVVDHVTTKLFAKSAAERFEPLGIDRLMFQLELALRIDWKVRDRFLKPKSFVGIRDFNKRAIADSYYRKFLLEVLDNNLYEKPFDQDRFIELAINLTSDGSSQVVNEYLEKPMSERAGTIEDLRLILNRMDHGRTYPGAIDCNPEDEQ